MILRRITNAPEHKYDDDILEDELHKVVRQLNFAEEQDEAKRLLSFLLSLAEEHDCYLVEFLLLDFVMGKGCTECSKAVCESTFGKHPTFADMMRHHWFEHLMQHPIEDKPYVPKYPIVRNEAFYWHGFHFVLFYRLQTDNSLALEVLNHFASKGAVAAMQRVALYYFSKSRYASAFPLLELLHAKAQMPEWKGEISPEVIYKLAHLYSWGVGTQQNYDKAMQCFNEIGPCSYSLWGDKAKYQLGRIAEHQHDLVKAMYYYREVIDCYEYGQFSSYRDDHPKDSFPLRLEIAFRQTKKKLNTSVDSLKLVTCQKCSEVAFQLKVMMNAIVTIEWGDGETESVIWKVNDWSLVKHSYQSSGSYHITIKTDEENVLTGLHIVSRKAIRSLDVSRCKGLTHLLCPDQKLEQLSLSRAQYLSVLDVHGNKLHSLNLRKNMMLTIVDCSNNPLEMIGAVKHPPFRLLCIRKTRLASKVKRRFHSITRMNAGRMMSEGFVDCLAEPLLPTLLFYMKNSSWKDVLPIFQQENEESEVNISYPAMRRVYAMLKASRHVKQCPYKNGFMWVSGTWGVIAHKFVYRKTGRMIEGIGSEEEFYLYQRPWSMILGTAVKAKVNRLPFMGLPQPTNAYYVAMCLYNMVQNDAEMKKHKMFNCFL